MKIKNIIFDLGNVLMRWPEAEAVMDVFPDVSEPTQFFDRMRPKWMELNLGKLTEAEAINYYEQEMSLPREKIVELVGKLKTFQKPIEGSLELLKKLYDAGVPLYLITDNIREFMDYHEEHSNFLHFFSGMVVSADIHVLKPDERIYKALLDEHKLDPAESVFIDDIMGNVDGAKAVGMYAFQFTDAASCEVELVALGFEF